MRSASLKVRPEVRIGKVCQKQTCTVTDLACTVTDLGVRFWSATAEIAIIRAALLRR